jgi:hypothetical protein
MVMMFGLVTIGALVWVLASCMAGESDAEKRRRIGISKPAVLPSDGVGGPQSRQAA